MLIPIISQFLVQVTNQKDVCWIRLYKFIGEQQERVRPPEYPFATPWGSKTYLITVLITSFILTDCLLLGLVSTLVPKPAVIYIIYENLSMAASNLKVIVIVVLIGILFYFILKFRNSASQPHISEAQDQQNRCTCTFDD